MSSAQCSRAPTRLCGYACIGHSSRFHTRAIYRDRYRVYSVLCLLRPLTGMTVLAAIVMLPMSIVVFAHPEASRGMP